MALDICDLPSRAALSQHTSGPGLPRTSSQKGSSSFTLSRYASSSSPSVAASPVPPIGFQYGSGTLRAPGAPTPLQAHEGPSPFRFLAEDEDLPLTPMDVSPATPRTPKFAIVRHSPALAPPGLELYPGTHTVYQPRNTAQLVTLKRNESPPQPHHHSGGVPTVSPRPSLEQDTSRGSSPSMPLYELPLDEEEYVRYISAEYARLTRQKSISSTATTQHSRQHSHSTSHSRQVSRGRAVITNDTRRLSTRSLSPPRHQLHPEPLAEQALEAKTAAELQRHFEPVAHRRKESTTSKTSQRAQYYDFAAAKEAREQERLGVTDAQWANYPGKGRNLSSRSGPDTYPPPKPATAPVVHEAAVERPRVTPTPVKPALARLGSRLKSEVRGAFTKKPERQEGQPTRVVAPDDEVYRIGAVHWTELEG